MEIKVNACVAHGCEAPAELEFKYCQLHRTNALQTGIRLVQDPQCHLPNQARDIQFNLLPHLTAIEAVRYTEQLANAYTEMKKFCLLNKLEAAPPATRVKMGTAEFIQSEREKEENRPDSKRVKILRKAQDKMATQTQKKAALLGLSGVEAEKWFNEMAKDVDF